MTYETLRLIVYVIGVPTIVYLLWNAARQVRKIRAEDARLKEEAERNKKNPYAQMAEILEREEIIKSVKR